MNSEMGVTVTDRLSPWSLCKMEGLEGQLQKDRWEFVDLTKKRDNAQMGKSICKSHLLKGRAS